MGFNLGGALSGGLGGFLSGGGPGAIFGGLAGGFADDSSQQGPTRTSMNQSLNRDLQQTGSTNTTGQSVTNNTGFQNVNTTGTSTGTSTGTTSGAGTSGPAAFQMPFIMEMLNNAQGILNAPGSQIAGFNPTQLAGQNMLLNAAAPQIGQLGANAQATNQFLTNPALLDPASNPYLAASAQASLNPLINSLQRSVLPNIAGGATAAHGIGSSRQGIAEGNAINQFQQTSGDMLANQFSNAYQNGLGTMLAANAQAPQIASLLTAPGDIFNQVGGQQQALTQQQLLEPFMRLQQFQGFAGDPLGTDTTSTGTSTGTTTGQTTGSSQGVSGETSTTVSEQQQQQQLQQIIQQLIQGTGTSQLPATNSGPFAELGAGLGLGNLLTNAPNDLSSMFSGLFGGSGAGQIPLANNVMNPASTNPAFITGPV